MIQKSFTSTTTTHSPLVLQPFLQELTEYNETLLKTLKVFLLMLAPEVISWAWGGNEMKKLMVVVDVDEEKKMFCILTPVYDNII